MNKKHIASVLGLGATAVAFPGYVLAQGLDNALPVLDKHVKNKVNASDLTLAEYIGAGIQAALSLVGVIFLILVVYAGIKWMTARGESAPVEDAKKTIQAAIIGLVVVALAYAITSFVTGIFA
jgi:hypothetical protein